MRFSQRLQHNQIANDDLVVVKNNIYGEKAQIPILSEGMGVNTL